MALVKCPDCGKAISDQAPACVGCGRPMELNARSVRSAQSSGSKDTRATTTDTNMFYVKGTGGRDFGPFTQTELRLKYCQGEFTSLDYVRRGNSTEYQDPTQVLGDLTRATRYVLLGTVDSAPLTIEELKSRVLAGRLKYADRVRAEYSSDSVDLYRLLLKIDSSDSQQVQTTAQPLSIEDTVSESNKYKCESCGLVCRDEYLPSGMLLCSTCGGRLFLFAAVESAYDKHIKSASYSDGEIIETATGTDNDSESISMTMPSSRQCPFCAETVLYDAIKCKHCGEFLSLSTKSIHSPTVGDTQTLIQAEHAPRKSGEAATPKVMKGAIRWLIAIVGWLVLYFVYVLWKTVEKESGGGGFITGFIRGGLTFSGAFLLYKWAKSGRPNAPPTEKVNSAVPESAQLPISTNTREFYRAFLGDKNPEYYLAKFLHFDRQGHGLRASWNWPALLSGVWLLYRKMYGWFFVFCGIVVVSSLVEKSGHPGISFLIIAVPWVLFPVFANALYHNKVKQKIATAQLAVNEEQKIIEFLRRKGGVNTWVPWLYSGLVLIGIFAAIAVPNYLVYKEKAKSAQLNRGTSAQQQGSQSQEAQSESTVTPKDSSEAPRQSQTAPPSALPRSTKGSGFEATPSNIASDRSKNRLQRFRDEYPEYNDRSDDDLLGAIHRKYYSDKPFQEFRAKMLTGE